MNFCPRCESYKAYYYGPASDGELALHICEACGFKYEDFTLKVSPLVLHQFGEDIAKTEGPENLGSSGGLRAG